VREHWSDQDEPTALRRFAEDACDVPDEFFVLSTPIVSVSPVAPLRGGRPRRSGLNEPVHLGRRSHDGGGADQYADQQRRQDQDSGPKRSPHMGRVVADDDMSVRKV
jgi:hypothetical protein